MKHSPDAGFTLVEMLVTMVLGVLFVGTLYQLYIVTIQSATEANRDAKASIVGYELLRREVGDGTPTP
ncbi:MAG: prepilin-type N-terminal cleavage/methylation domain-containing protein, partial [Candidatus Saccharimonas sp.]